VINDGSAGALVDDKDPQELGNKKASLGGLGVVLVDRKVRTEEVLVAVAFGDAHWHRFAARWYKMMASDDAPEQGKKVRRE
jgi:hypothetical protein